MKRVALCLALLSLSGCYWEVRADEVSRLNRRMASWVGHDIHELVSTYGPPAGIYENGPGRIYTWIAVGPTVAYAAPAGYGYMATAGQASCREWFDVGPDDRVLGWHWQGNCR